jgi:uncharacterized protein
LALSRATWAQDALRSEWLLYTKSAGFEHATIRREGEAPSFLARQLAPVFAARRLSLTESKDGRLFEPADIGRFQGFVFYTSGDLTTPGTDGEPPMTAAGKQALLDAVAAGVPFIGLHCAADTFRTEPTAAIDPYIKMLGGEFEAHGEQQRGIVRVVDEALGGKPDAWNIVEEWYALRRIADDVRPVHLLEPQTLKGDMYRREPFPITWTRQHKKGRVFYTAIGHREDVVASPAYAMLIGKALDWCVAR